MEMLRLRPDLARLLRPRSIAVFGGAAAAEVVRQCERMGFDGPIWPVHPSRETLAGRPCFRSVEALPAAPDAAFVGVNRHATLEILRALAARGAGGAVAYASGFKESADGAELQAALIEAAGAMPVLGPNCYGFINYLDGALLWPDQHGGRRVARGVAIVTQSSNIAINLTMQRRGLPVGYVLTLGNQAKLGLSHAIDALVDDPRVSAIGLHIEGIDEPAAFAAAARRAHDRGVPLVALKAGHSPVGQRLTLSHTASLAGADAVVEAFLKRCGIARVPSLTAFLETLKLLHVHGGLAGGAIASLSCSGGEATLMADAGEGRDFTFRPLSETETARVKATLSDLVSVSNPLDYHTFIWDDPARLAETFAAMLGCGFDLSLLVLDYPRADRCDDRAWRTTAAALGEAARRTGAKAALVASLPDCLPEAVAEALVAEGIAPLMGIDDALSAVEAAVALGRTRAGGLPPSVMTGSRLAAGEARVLDEWRSKRRLAAYGLALPAGRLVASQAEAIAAAEDLGFPVALKAVSETLYHKSDVGGVALGLADAGAVGAAAEAMAGLAPRFLVERMVPGALAELIVGVDRDPQLGPYLMLGSGGVLVDLVKDGRVLLLPASRAEIEAAIRSLRAFGLIAGFRGRPAGDLAAAVDAVEAVARFAADHAERIIELDVNPLLVLPDGAVAVDALIRLIEGSHEP